jgi:hypothetical protein
MLGRTDLLVSINSEKRMINCIICLSSRGGFTMRIEEITIDGFFYDEPDMPWTPLPPQHEPYQSPCFPIIGKKILYARIMIDEDNWISIPDYGRPITWYYCRLHPGIDSIHLEVIEHHCKYKEPEEHKAAILEYLFQLKNK